MSRLLIVAPAFPPHPSPATHRARFLARHAAAFGWECEVLTVDPRDYEEALDPELLRLVPPGLAVHRVRAVPARFTRPFGISELGLRAHLPLRRALRRLLRRSRYDLLFIPGGPFYPFVLGADMREAFGIPYVLDYTDPWVFRLTPAQRTPLSKAYWARWIATRLEPRVARLASHILAVSDGTNAEIAERYPDIPAERFSAVPFGFEASDFETLRAHPRPNPYWDAADGNIHLAYVGAMLPHGFETLRALFAAVGTLRARDPGRFGRLRLHFFGTTYDARATGKLVEPVAVEMGLAGVVDEHPRRIPYLDALNALVSAQGVLALGSTEHHYTASKIFPCILARRPLLAVYHRASTVCQVVAESGAGELVTYDDVVRAGDRVDAIASALVGVIDRAGETTTPRTAAMEQYSARRMSEHIFSVFDRLVKRETRRAPARMVAHA